VLSEEVARQSSPDAAIGGAWFVLPPLRPTGTPVRELAQRLAPYLAPWGAVPDASRWRRDPRALAGALAAWDQANPGWRMLLVVDQLEELVTLCQDDDERERFLALLAEAVRQHPDALRLVVTLRTDFEPQFTDTFLFTDHGSRSRRYVVPPMDQADLRQVIEGPATQRVLYFEPSELVDRFINEVVQMPGALPLLSFTLSEMYLRYVRSGRDDRALTDADYEALGGVIGSLRQRATEEYDALPDDLHQATMQRVMLRMISTEGGELARRRVMLSELEYPTPEENQRVQTVLDQLVEARLLVRGGASPSTRYPRPRDGDSPELVSEGEGAAEPYVEPAHDALMAAWDRLLQWKREAEEYLPLQRRTAQAAGEWARAPESEKPGLLWNDDPRLPQLERALAPAGEVARRGPLARARRTLWPNTATPRETAWLNRRELAFTQASILRRARVLKRIVGITAAVIIALAGLAVVALLQAGLARDNAAEAVAEADRRATEVVVRTTAQAAEAEARQLAQTREADAQAAATAEAEAHALADQRRAEAEAEARRSRAGELAALSISAPEWTPEQSLLLAVEAMSTTLKYNEPAVPSAQQALRDVLGRPDGLPLGSGDGLLSDILAFSPDAHWLAACSYSYDEMPYTYNVQLWSTADPLAPPLVLRGQQDRVRAMAFSSDGRWLATGSSDGNIRLWAIADLQAEPMVLHGEQTIAAVQFSPDGHWLAAVDIAYTVSLWNVTGPKVELLETSSAADVAGAVDVWLGPAALAFYPDSKWLVTAGPEGTALLWNVANGLVRSSVLRGHQGEVRAVAFSPNGRWLATGSADSTVRLWNVAHPETNPLVLQGHESWITSVAFSPDSTQLLTGSADDTARLWDLSRPKAEPVVLRNSKFPIDAVAFSPDGRWMVTGSQWETHLWNASDPLETPRVLWGHEGAVRSVIFSPDSRWLATSASPATAAHFNETVRLWNMADLQPDPVILASHEAEVRAVAISASGRWVATAPSSDASRVRLWDLTDPPEEPGLAGTYTGTVYTLAFSPDDSRLAAACRDGFIRLWNTSDLAAAPIVLSTEGWSPILGFSPDGKWLVNGSDRGTVHLWNLTETEAEPSLLQGHRDRVTAADFSSDGRRLATSSADGTVRVWDLGDLPAEPLILRGDEPQILDVAFSSNGRWLATGQGTSAGGSGDVYPARLWDLSDPSLQPTLLPGHKENVSYVAFSPDGRWLATAPATDFDTDVRLWEVADPESPPILLQGHEEMILDMAFSPDGRWLATASADDTAHLWDMANPQAEPVVLRGHGEMVIDLAFGPDSRWLVTGSRDNTARAWRVRQDDLMGLACLFAGRNFTDAEWKRYFPDDPYRKTCPSLPVHSSTVISTSE
jgi:WD40 repeat protein